MKSINLKTASELKQFLKSNRKNITNINGIVFGDNYPMLESTNKHVSYYDVNTQGNKYLTAPFIINLQN